VLIHGVDIQGLESVVQGDVDGKSRQLDSEKVHKSSEDQEPMLRHIQVPETRHSRENYRNYRPEPDHHKNRLIIPDYVIHHLKRLDEASVAQASNTGHYHNGKSKQEARHERTQKRGNQQGSLE
jgi:hypothetical protein